MLPAHQRISCLPQHAETVRRLAESLKLLTETPGDMHKNRELLRIDPHIHSTPCPDFIHVVASRSAKLEGTPFFTVLFGESSVRSSALLREQRTALCTAF